MKFRDSERKINFKATDGADSHGSRTQRLIGIDPWPLCFSDTHRHYDVAVLVILALGGA